MIHVDMNVSSKCWNLYDSYGEICVHCGCCSKDPITRYKARLECVTRWKHDNEAFDGWSDDPALRRVQRRNVMVTLDRLRRQERYYEKKYREAVNGKGEVQAKHTVQQGAAANS